MCVCVCIQVYDGLLEQVHALLWQELDDELDQEELRSYTSSDDSVGSMDDKKSYSGLYTHTHTHTV